jgi:hypothetical protein
MLMVGQDWTPINSSFALISRRWRLGNGSQRGWFIGIAGVSEAIDQHELVVVTGKESLEPPAAKEGDARVIAWAHDHCARFPRL